MKPNQKIELEVLECFRNKESGIDVAALSCIKNFSVYYYTKTCKVIVETDMDVDFRLELLSRLYAASGKTKISVEITRFDDLIKDSKYLWGLLEEDAFRFYLSKNDNEVLELESIVGNFKRYYEKTMELLRK